MAGYPVTRASFILAVSFSFLFGLAGHAWCAKEASPAAAVDTKFDCYQCHNKKEITPWITMTWAESLHAKKGVKCPDCHGNHDSGFDSVEFTARPKSDKCMPCHPLKVKEVMASKHSGAVKCTSCHPRHTFSLEVARNPMICATCHLDSTHVQGYSKSKMGVVYETLDSNYSATCQTCHMPDGSHDVDMTLDNRELMLKVCNKCHSASFAGEVLSSGRFKTHW